jgi:hypothetical protein
MGHVVGCAAAPAAAIIREGSRLRLGAALPDSRRLLRASGAGYDVPLT